MLNKFHRLGYSESYTETQNYKYCFLNGRSRDDVPATSGTLDAIVEETDEQINDDVAVDTAPDAAFEDKSLITAKVPADESELSCNYHVVSMKAGETNNAVTKFVGDNIYLNIVSIIATLPSTQWNLLLWSPFLIKHITQLEKIQRSFTKHITGMNDMPYHELLKRLGLYSLQRRRERYCIIYILTIVEGLDPNFSNPITSTFSRRRGRSCVISHVNVGRVGTLAYNSFRWRSIRLFNSLPMHLRSISLCSVLRFKTQLDSFLGSVEDLLCLPGFNNSLDGRDCRCWSHRDGLATN